MDTFIFGIGCSGTTMIYSLLQSVFTRAYGENYYSTYEPFIWDREKFNRPYKKAGSLFGRTSSISVEGIYNHVKTPMFVDSATSDDQIGNEFFRHFTATHGPGQAHLAKLIRANGRMAVFRALNSQARFVLVVRNPVDNINCAKYKFSFYGEDFYPSDYPRFCEQLKKENKLVLDQENAGWAQKQAEYCYQMNRTAVDFAVLDTNTKILEYDNFIQNRSSSVMELCEFLEVPYNDDYVNQLQWPVGPVTASNVLSQSEYDSILCYDKFYSEVCERAGVARGKSTTDIQHQYNGKCSSTNFDSEHEESATNRLRRVINAQKNQIRQLERQLKQNNQG